MYRTCLSLDGLSLGHLYLIMLMFCIIEIHAEEITIINDILAIIRPIYVIILECS